MTTSGIVKVEVGGEVKILKKNSITNFELFHICNMQGWNFLIIFYSFLTVLEF